jgi:hypothetical protein
MVNEFVSEEYQINISDHDREGLLVAVFRMAAENHLGCTKLLFELLDRRMPRDWDYRRPSTHNTDHHSLP